MRWQDHLQHADKQEQATSSLGPHIGSRIFVLRGMQEVDEEALIEAAEQMESVKLSMSLGQLLPQKLAYA
jgi:hypothetical protein